MALAICPVRTKVSHLPVSSKRLWLMLASSFSGCALAGAQPGATSIDGAIYLATTFDFYRSHLWRSKFLLDSFVMPSLMPHC